MATQGWYPDPGGRPGVFRYWDGQAWSAHTRTDAAQAGGGSPAQRSRSSRSPLIIGLVVVALLIAGGVVLAIRGTADDRMADPGPLPSSTVSGWDDSSPFPSDDPTPTPTPSPSAEASGSIQPEDVACPDGDPSSLGGTPTDGRIHGGKLSFAKVDSYGPPRSKYGLSWFYDVSSQSQSTEPAWESWFAVGEVAVGDYFTTSRQAAVSSMQCVVNEGFFSQFSGRKVIRNEAITIDGRKGWIIKAEIRVDQNGLSVEGDQVTFIFIDDGRADRLSGYCGIVPIGDGPRTKLEAQVQSSLRVN